MPATEAGKPSAIVRHIRASQSSSLLLPSLAVADGKMCFFTKSSRLIVVPKANAGPKPPFGSELERIDGCVLINQ